VKKETFQKNPLAGTSTSGGVTTVPVDTGDAPGRWGPGVSTGVWMGSLLLQTGVGQHLFSQLTLDWDSDWFSGWT
jgi:hypothetical protein